MKKRKGRKAFDKERLAEDWCFRCKDGGDLLICDYKQCLKAYHCQCVEKDDSFMLRGKRWSCDWHKCCSCRKASRFHCFCCPIAVCNSCASIQQFVHIKGKYGMCSHCLKLSLLIEENKNVDSDGEQVDFSGRDTVEGLFKEYYDLKKGSLGLNSKVLSSAKTRLGLGRNYPSDSDVDQYDEVGDSHLPSDDESIDDSEGERQLPKRKRSKGKQPLNREKRRPSKIEFDGWASKSLIQFLSLIGKNTSKNLSQHEVTSIINDYIKQNNLHDPKMKKRILCDAYLQSVFRKKVVHKNRVKDLLEAHFYENQEESEEEEDETESNFEKDNHKGKGKRKREEPRIEREPSVPQSRFSAIVAENIRLVYIKRSLLNELHKQHESFKDKITGCFVRVKAHPHDIYQRNSHLLMQVTGVKQALTFEKISDIVLLVSEFPGEIPISMLSDCDFSVEELEDLTRRVNAGLLEKPTLVELEKKARILHKDITKHWIDKELKLLKHKIDRANEKGWRQELFEYRQKKELLQTQLEQERLLNNIPSVVPDVEEVQSDCDEDNKTNLVHTPAPADTLISPESLPDVELVVLICDEDNKSKLGESPTTTYTETSPRSFPDLEELKFTRDEDNKTNKGESPTPEATWASHRSLPVVEEVESDCDEDNKSDQVELTAPANTSISPGSLPDVKEVNFVCDKDDKTKLGKLPIPGNAQMSSLNLPDLEYAKSVADVDNKTDKGELPTPETTWTSHISLTEVQDDALLQNKFQQSTSEGGYSMGVCSHVERHPEKTIFSSSSSRTKQNLDACFGEVMSNDNSARTTDVIELSSDDDDEDRISRVIVGEINCEDVQLPVWRISDRDGKKSGTFSLSMLRMWSVISPYAKTFKVWKENQTEDDAVLLGDAIKVAFGRG